LAATHRSTQLGRAEHEGHEGESKMDIKAKLLKLRELAQLDVDAIGTYDAAIARATDEAVKTKLTEFRLDHVRHLQDLNALVVKLGGEQVEQKPDLKGTALKVMTQVTSMLGTDAALVAMAGNEGITNLSYEMALKTDWTGEERELIEKNREDERRHLNWIRETLRERLRARVRMPAKA
jgi:rubrerythrin